MSHKQLLMDFYLNLLAKTTKLEFLEIKLAVLSQLAAMLETDKEVIERIFERMADEDC